MTNVTLGFASLIALVALATIAVWRARRRRQRGVASLRATDDYYEPGFDLPPTAVVIQRDPWNVPTSEELTIAPIAQANRISGSIAYNFAAEPSMGLAAIDPMPLVHEWPATAPTVDPTPTYEPLPIERADPAPSYDALPSIDVGSCDAIGDHAGAFDAPSFDQSSGGDQS